MKKDDFTWLVYNTVRKLQPNATLVEIFIEVQKEVKGLAVASVTFTLKHLESEGYIRSEKEGRRKYFITGKIKYAPASEGATPILGISYA